MADAKKAAKPPTPAPDAKDTPAAHAETLSAAIKTLAVARALAALGQTTAGIKARETPSLSAYWTSLDTPTKSSLIPDEPTRTTLTKFTATMWAHFTGNDMDDLRLAPLKEHAHTDTETQWASAKEDFMTWVAAQTPDRRAALTVWLKAHAGKRP